MEIAKSSLIQQNKKYLLVFIGCIILVLGVTYFYSYSMKTKISELCGKYESLDTPVSCEQAINITLLKYDGEVVSVKREQISMPLPPNKGGGFETVDAWVVGVRLKEPRKIAGLMVNKLEVIVDTTTGKIRGSKSLEVVR